MKQSVSKETVARSVALFIALINQVVILFGGNEFPFTQDEVYQAASTVITVALSLWAWWKNNSFTRNALAADLYKENLSSQEKEKTE